MPFDGIHKCWLETWVIQNYFGALMCCWLSYLSSSVVSSGQSSKPFLSGSVPATKSQWSIQHCLLQPLTDGLRCKSCVSVCSKHWYQLTYHIRNRTFSLVPSTVTIFCLQSIPETVHDQYKSISEMALLGFPNDNNYIVWKDWLQNFHPNNTIFLLIMPEVFYLLVHKGVSLSWIPTDH